MFDTKKIFSEFPDLSKADWLKKVNAELKGKQFEELRWNLEEIQLEPFYQKEDLKGVDQHISAIQSTNDWTIGEDVLLTDAKQSNKLLLEALSNGVDAAHLISNTASIETESLRQILDSVRLDFIESYFHLSEKQNLAQFTTAFLNFLQEQKIDPQQIKGGIFSVAKEEAKQVLETAKLLPQFKLIRIKINASGDLCQDLAQGIWEASQYISDFGAEGISVDQTNQLIQFSVAIGKQYFVEIAKIRALKLLWANILRAFEAKSIYDIDIEARLAKNSQLEDTNRNMISATTQSMSAVLAGVNSLNVLPADDYTGEQNRFTKRIARNVQHLLKMESYLDQVIDPAAGSYYVENLTQHIFQKTWQHFLHLEQQALS